MRLEMFAHAARSKHPAPSGHCPNYRQDTCKHCLRHIIFGFPFTVSHFSHFSQLYLNLTLTLVNSMNVDISCLNDRSEISSLGRGVSPVTNTAKN